MPAVGPEASVDPLIIFVRAKSSIEFILLDIWNYLDTKPDHKEGQPNEI